MGGGCFWCLEALYQEVRGVEAVVSGYAGGHNDDPNYEQVCSGTTGHAEVVEVTFDPAIISYRSILEIFFYSHDPTTLNRQGHDVGTQYRSIILYRNDEQKRQAEAVKADFAAKLWDDPIVTEIVPLERFWPAEAYHANYFREHPEQAYCQIIINPKLAKFRQKFQSLLKR
ncbi:MAG TPA: peptide-methionine (S)-S-oxide reductase MsrA [Candidatus Saccharimonadales bacterium]|nr:peptide-methionine (S)-S-oxide reductase MsrA [Candidatus Saccharimonadales bacterium]